MVMTEMPKQQLEQGLLDIKGGKLDHVYLALLGQVNRNLGKTLNSRKLKLHDFFVKIYVNEIQ